MGIWVPQGVSARQGPVHPLNLCWSLQGDLPSPATSSESAGRVVPSFPPRATTRSTESSSPVWVIGTVQRVILEAQNEAFGKQLLVEPKRPREETPWSRVRRNVLLQGRVFKDTSGVCFLATGLIQNMLAVSEHPTMPTSTVENTIKICRARKESLSVAPLVGREAAQNRCSSSWFPLESSEEKSSYPGTPSHLPPGGFIPSSESNHLEGSPLLTPPSFPATWRPSVQSNGLL